MGVPANEVDGVLEIIAIREAATAAGLFVRDWKGNRYEVTVVKNGYEYEGRLYRSLSAIAKEITGTHWNGKLFFGCRQSKKNRKAAQ